jgi:hypothetical protein
MKMNSKAVKQWFNDKLAPKPALLLLNPFQVTTLAYTFFTFFRRIYPHSPWTLLDVYNPQEFFVKKSWLGDWIFKINPEISKFLDRNKILYRTGIYIQIPTYLQLSDDLNIFGIQMGTEMVEANMLEAAHQVQFIINNQSTEDMQFVDKSNIPHFDLSKLNFSSKPN